MAQASQAAQTFVPIKEIRSGVVVLKNGGLRAVILVSSLNFALKSEAEQQAIIAQFQNLLNGLEFPIQISIQSRDLDIRPYIALLEEQIREQRGDLIRLQIQEYITFIKSFSEAVNIMAKSFFVVIPYAPPLLGTTKDASGFVKGLFSKEQKNSFEKQVAAFEEQRSQLEQRVGVIQQGLSRCGLRAAPLRTEELVEVYYKIFNPGESEKPIPLKGE